MTPVKINIPGNKVENKPADNSAALRIEATYIVGAGTRGEPEKRHPEQLDEQKIVEFVFDDDTVWFGDYATMDEVFPGSSAQLRGIGPAAGRDGFDIPTELYVDESKGRGLLSRVLLKVVKIFTKNDPLAPLVRDLAAELEKKQLTGRSGLFRLNKEFGFEKPSPGGQDKYLLFVHGTASSTTGSFYELKGSPPWNFIHQNFGSNVLAFEHETLTKSPLENVLQLIAELPQKAALTIISHSRGGLVGDVLNRFCNDSPQRGFSAQEKNYLRKHGCTDELRLIEEIEKAIPGKDISIDKFIRVAGTASGTTLASGRLNIYVNVILNLIGLSAGQSGSPLYTAFRDLIAALLEYKDDASVLPGLEVQSPRSPFNQMLNNAHPETLISTPLVVISGDASLSLRWSAIKVILSNLFFWNDNDFIVDTRSMYNGAKRKEGVVQYFFDQGATVSHFSYFKNEKTQNALLLALRNADNRLIPGFSVLTARTFTEEEIRNISLPVPGGKLYQDGVSGKKPIVVLLPGIMGSTLSVSDRPVWIHFAGFAVGHLNRLQYNTDNNKNVRADGLVASSYRRLAEFLKRDYDVVTFPFDWRSSTESGAASLNRKIEQLMEYGQPIKLLGHSMGGVLIRDFIMNHGRTWEKLKATRDFRIVFLGAPLSGSFRIPYVLFGLDGIIKKLDFIDFTNSQQDLIGLFSRFPGLLGLLPLTTDKGNDFARRDTWDLMRRAFGRADWPIPDQEALDAFGTYRNKVLQHAGSIDYSQAVYIAGQAGRKAQTICGYQMPDRARGPVLEFLATGEGDESVTWNSIPGEMLARNSVYFSDVPHGELANDPKLFAPIADLLADGSTLKLKRARPSVRGAEKEFKAKESFDFDLSPAGVERTLMGLQPEVPFTSGDVPIKVSVSNGDLRYAMYPIMVGHFEMDAILYAEKAIDDHLNGELSRRRRLGLYPGEIGTNEIITTDGYRGFNGAIVVGLGIQGLLTEHRLTTTVEHGISRYLANLNCRKDPAPGKSQKVKPNGITVLLIGSNYGGLSIENSIRAIIRGVQNANAKVRLNYEAGKLIDTIEFGELYRDRALACVKAITAMERDETQSLNIIMSGGKIKENIGWRERLPIDNTTEWWTRVNVSRYKEEERAGQGKQPDDLKFAISTHAARVEEKTLTTVNKTLTDMLEGLSGRNAWTPEDAKVIFELMIPNEFKDQIKRQNNINWILDKYTAAFPWELLQDSVTSAFPLSVSAGMIRQLATGEYRLNVKPVVEPSAIVIADPDLGNPSIQLPYAESEGNKVADLLCIHGYDLIRVVKGKSAEILGNLFKRDYKIVHLAGHGIFETDPKKPTGMLIGPDAVLTPAHINQMSNVPELVFVNCCYLGQMDGIAEGNRKDRVRLAANIGTQLIEIGVRAVVVAGWAVDDKAALEFAEHFYEHLLAGYNFGASIQKARKAVFEHSGSRSNTWGAYQCYGDPFYRLTNDFHQTKEEFEFIIPEEAEIELSNLLNKVEGGVYDPEDIMEKMDAIEHALSKAGIRNGRIIELQAFLYSSLNRYDLASVKFNEMWKEENANFTFAATAKSCNNEVRLHALEVQKKGLADKQAVTEAIKGITDAIAKLEPFTYYGESVERMQVLATAYKRLAIISSGNAKARAYECAAGYYQKSYQASRHSTRCYLLTNWISIAVAGVSRRKSARGSNQLPAKKELVQRISRELEQIPDRDDGERTYLDWISEANMRLCLRMLGDKAVTQADIEEPYISGLCMFGSDGQYQYEIEHLQMLEDVLRMNKQSKAILEIVVRLQAALNALR